MPYIGFMDVAIIFFGWNANTTKIRIKVSLQLSAKSI